MPQSELFDIRLDRREFFGALGSGLLVTAFAADASVVARIHVGDDGGVTVFSGKVEEGQGPRTELAMAAAEEMGIPLARVRVQLADTDRTPDDGITAGSRTTPATVPAVRKAAAAARKATEVKAHSEWKMLGRGQWRTDAKEMVTGEHVFPSDVVREGMMYGCVLRPPAYGAVLESVDTSAPGTTGGAQVVREGSFVACVGRSSYDARKAVEALAAQAKWKGASTGSSDSLFADLRSRAKEKVEPLAKRTHSAEYHAAYVQHAPMEPRAAVAEWKDGKLTVWAGTTNPFRVREELAQAFGLKAGDVRVIVPDMGGGFGGKHSGEAAIEAARMAKTTGRPVKVRWTRAEEFAWAYFRPAALIDAEAELSRDGVIRSWQFTNYNSGGAALRTPYRIGTVQEKYVECSAPLRQGSYRALASTANNFAREAFMDELAEAAGADPLEFRLRHLENSRICAVLEAASDKFRWRERRRVAREKGRGIGLACGTEKNSVVAACVEVEVDSKTGEPRLTEIVEAFECGAVLNPANTKSQVEGCILMGLGAAVREKIEFENGRLMNGSFRGYRVTRMRDVPPKFEVVLLDRRDQESAGAGETPIIAVAPAMANAVWDATGKRRRAMPL
jgi:isoquinoline 1-oxidoreductase